MMPRLLTMTVNSIGHDHHIERHLLTAFDRVGTVTDRSLSS